MVSLIKEEGAESGKSGLYSGDKGLYLHFWMPEQIEERGYAKEYGADKRRSQFLFQNRHDWRVDSAAGMIFLE